MKRAGDELTFEGMVGRPGTQRVVAPARGFVVDDIALLSNDGRTHDDAFDMRPALRLIRSEDFVAASAAQNEVEPPGEVHDIAQARAEPLPEERRHDVGRIARKENGASTPLVSQFRFKSVD